MNHPKQEAHRNLTVLDGPIGTELNARGIRTPLPGWSASAIESAPEVIAEIHRDYARAGATIHTANTFRTKSRNFPANWRRLTQIAVQVARDSIPADHRVAGSLAPLEDCYRPDLAPKNAYSEHRELAEYLADCGCDLILCETFPNPNEAMQAVEAAVATGLPTWLAMTAGPEGNLLDPESMAAAAREAADRGAQAVLANCIPAKLLHRWIQALCRSDLGVPIGGYANAGAIDDQIGWQSSAEPGANQYADLARNWIHEGATIIGGCCGTGPSHIAALAKLREVELQ